VSPVASVKPTSIRVRMYNVGFGDCFLLTFRYPGGTERHMLIDYGTNAKAKGGLALDDLGLKIAADTGGKLAAVVLSHRHRDHIGGFDPDIGGTSIKGLQPDVVLRPWTEEPGVEESGDPAFKLRRDLATALRSAEDLASDLERAAGSDDRRSLRGRIGAFAARQLKNRHAVELLHELSEGGRGRYLSAGEDPGTSDALPGVRITVLGPPLPDVWPAIRRQRADDDEFWLRMRDTLPAALALNGAAGDDEPGAPAANVDVRIGPEAWLVDKLRREGLHSTLRVVLTLDKALNNTSLILLIEAAGRRLLFPGDAQIENWSYSLSGPGSSERLTRKLAALDLYKVGHHGSRNATPKLGLLPLWLRPGAKRVPVAMLSTLEGQYDEAYPVPAQNLVDRLLQPPLRLINTDTFPTDARVFADVEL
jgi:hypothetical protein